MQPRFAALGLLLLAGCAGSSEPSAPAPQAAAQESTSGGRPQYASTYTRRPGPLVLIRNATILTAAGQELQGASILLRDGKIVGVGADVTAPGDAVLVDGTGKFVTPAGA